MGGVAIEDEMEKRKHTECHLRVVRIPVSSRLSCLIMDLIRFGRQWQRSRCRKKPINAVKAARAKPLANHASFTLSLFLTRGFLFLSPSPSLSSQYSSFPVLFALCRSAAAPALGCTGCVCVFGKDCVTRCLCVSVKGPHKGNSDRPTTQSAK